MIPTFWFCVYRISEKTQSKHEKKWLFHATALHSGSSRSGRSGGSPDTVRWTVTTACTSLAAQQMFKRCLADNTFVQVRGALFSFFFQFRKAPCHPNPACRGHTVLQRGICCRHKLARLYAPITCTTKGVEHHYTLLQTQSTKVCRNM